MTNPRDYKLEKDQQLENEKEFFAILNEAKLHQRCVFDEEFTKLENLVKQNISNAEMLFEFAEICVFNLSDQSLRQKYRPLADDIIHWLALKKNAEAMYVEGRKNFCKYQYEEGSIREKHTAAYYFFLGSIINFRKYYLSSFSYLESLAVDELKKNIEDADTYVLHLIAICYANGYGTKVDFARSKEIENLIALASTAYNNEIIKSHPRLGLFSVRKLSSNIPQTPINIKDVEDSKHTQLNLQKNGKYL